MESIEFLSGIIIVSKQAEQLAQFYQDVIGIELEAEDHGGLETHWGTELGDIHFAIHPQSNFPNSPAGNASVKLAFTVFDLDAVLCRLEDYGVALAQPVKEDEGFGRMVAIEDPDGNFVELTELTDHWFQHLEQRKKKGHDPVARWKQRRV
jgi:predicted enzyme related to lactoylglutathione lyase